MRRNNNGIRFSFLLAGLVIVLCGSGCVGAPVVPYDYGEIVYVDLDFEDGTHGPWEAHYTEDQYGGENHFEISTDTPADGGNHSGRFYIGAGGDFWTSPNTGFQSARSEIALKGTAHEGHEIYYAMSVKIDESYVEADGWQIFMQFHDQPDPAIGETWATFPAHSPPLALKYRFEQLVIAVVSFETDSVMEIVSSPLSKGDWHDIMCRVYWSTDDDGFMEFWLDGVQIESGGETRYTARNCVNNAGNYINVGLYRSPEIDSVGMLYLDNVRSGPTAESVE